MNKAKAKDMFMLVVEFSLFVLLILTIFFLILSVASCNKAPLPPPVPPPPITDPVLDLSVDKIKISAGESVTLSWVVPAGAQGVIEPIGQTVTGVGSMQHAPSASTTYVLSIVLNGRTVETSVRVIVR